MMKFHKPGRLRLLGGTAAVVMLGGLSLAFGSASAQPAPSAPPSAAAPHDGERHEERVIVRTYRSDEHRDHNTAEHRGADGDRHVERNVRIITTDGEGHGDAADHHRMMEMHGDHAMVMMSDHDCQSANRSEVSEGNDSNRTRVIVCTRAANGEANPAQQAQALQRARERLAGDSEIPADQRQRVLAAIDREIARLRGQ
jgi:hypothetical protein